MTCPAIEAHGLGFTHIGSSSNPLFEELNLSIPRGSIYGLLGPNGCGKTTLMNMLHGRLKASPGRLEALGLDPWQRPLEVRSRVALVPQNNDLDPKLTIDQTLRLFYLAYKERWRFEEAEARLRRFGLDDRRQDLVESLSGGLAQRLNLVLALAASPEILLLDEPTAGLDPVVRRDFSESVVDFMAEDPERTVVISSHLLSEIEPLIDHVGMFHVQGSRSVLLVDASLEDLKEKILVVRFDDPSAIVDTEALGRFLSPIKIEEGEVSPLPKAFADLPGLLTISRDASATSVFWAASADEARIIGQKVTDMGGRVSESHSLDDIFVGLFQESMPVPGRRVLGGILHESR